MWRFRKIFNFGAFRTSVSKGGVGYSYGFFGLRFGVTPYGKKYVSFGIPGTGLYFIKYLTANNNFNNAKSNTSTNPSTSKKQINSMNRPPAVEWWKQKDLDKF